MVLLGHPRPPRNASRRPFWGNAALRFVASGWVCLLSGVLTVALGCHPVAATATAPPVRSHRTVLILNQTDASSRWHAAVNAAIRSTLREQSAGRVTVHEEYLNLRRFSGQHYEQALNRFLRDKYHDQKLDLIVAVGVSALELWLRLREELWSGVPVVFAAVDEVTGERLRHAPNLTGTTGRMAFRDHVTVARALVPGLEGVAIVGDPPERQPSRRHFRQEFSDFAKELTLIDLLGLSIEEVRQGVSRLPERTVIAYMGIYTDGAGVAIPPRDGLEAVAEVANRPIVVDVETHFGHGATGGIVIMPAPVGKAAASLAMRILDGERASDIPVARGDFSRLVFDWRELQKWKISDRDLPPGSRIRNRPPDIWDQYRSQAITALGVVLAQAAMIGWLLLERRRRLAAELDSRLHLLEVMHLNRTATAGALSASIAHELNQPLGAILSNAETAELLLKNEVLDHAQLKAILGDIRQDDQRAGDIIKRLRGLLTRRDVVDLQLFDLNEPLREAVRILGPEARKNGISISFSQSDDPLRVRADRVHLQQVILNLATNAMDAMLCNGPSPRRLMLSVAQAGDSVAEVSVSDTGTGIAAGKLRDVFNAFFTTKREGTGIGLSIARAIVETHGGTIWAENRAGGGAVFRFTVPLVGGTSP